MTQVRSTLLGTSKEQLPGRPQEERGGSPEGVLAQVLFTAEGSAREAALRQIEAELSLIRQETPAITQNVVQPEVTQVTPYRSLFVPEVVTPSVTEPQSVEKPREQKLFGIFPQKSLAAMARERQAKKAA